MADVISEFRTYIGISDSTITDGTSPVIMVAIPEFEPLEAGDMSEMKLVESNTIDPIGSTSGVALIKKVRTVKCTYFGSDCNQCVPCVHKGERVLVINYAGTEQYYWKAWGRDPGLRANERVRWIAMNKPVSVEGLDNYSDVSDENSYFVEMNTNGGNKCLRLHTGTSDGEPHSYDVVIFPESGMLEITDNASSGNPVSGNTNSDKGNCIRLISDGPLWRISNIAGSYINLDGPNIDIFAPNNITMTAGNNILTKCGNNYDSIVGVNRTEVVGANNTKTVSASETNVIGKVKTENVGETMMHTCPNNIVNGDIMTVNMLGALVGTAGAVAVTGVGAVAVTAGGALSLAGSSVAYKGAHSFTGSAFTVGTAHGVIPGLVIVFGSNAW